MSNTDILKSMNIAFENERSERIETEIDSTIRVYLTADVKRGEEPLSNTFSVFSNYLKMIIRRKLVNPNYILSSIIKWTRSYVGLFLMGMVIREGANPNIYLTFPGKGNLHVLAWASVVKEPGNIIYNYISLVLRMMGSDIFRPALRFEGDSTDMDVRLVEQSFEDLRTDDSYYYRAGLNVKDYVAQNGYVFEESITPFLNSMDDQWLLVVLIAADDVTRFNSVTSKDATKNQWEYISSILDNNVSLTRFILDLSTASAENIVTAMDVKRYPLLSDVINGQSIPLFAASVSCDRDMFELFIRKGSSVKYVTINTIVSFYKIFKQNEIKLYENCFHMLNDAVKIGADIDLYQFNFFVSVADYDDIEKIRNSYQTPKWKKLCSVKKNNDGRPELRQIAFNLNLDYSMSDDKICNKLEQIASMGTDQYFESAVRRQEERVAIETEGPVDYGAPPENSDIVQGAVGQVKSRCAEKSMIINNPYAYNDARMAFFKDPNDGQVWCFTSDTFSSLLTSKVNPYTGRKLPIKFLSTIKSHLSTLKEIGVVESNENIKDSLKEIYSRSVINNKKTEAQYETVVKILSLYGVSQERLESLRGETLKDTILGSIAGVNLVNFNVLPGILKLRTTTRIIYSLAKNATPEARKEGQVTDEMSKELFISIARAISGDAPNLTEYLNSMGGEEEEEEEDGFNRPEDFDTIIGKNY